MFNSFRQIKWYFCSCSEDARQVAVVGFLQIMKHFRFYTPASGASLSQASLSSQATVDIHHSQSSNANRQDPIPFYHF